MQGRPPFPSLGSAPRRSALQLIGREPDVAWVTGWLQRRGTAFVWGGPGEGKTSVAMEAACRLQEDGLLLDAVVIDMNGVRRHCAPANVSIELRILKSCMTQLRSHRLS